MGASAIANNVSAHFGLEGITANIVNACAAGTMSIGYACDLIREGKGDVFIAGGSTAFLHLHSAVSTLSMRLTKTPVPRSITAQV